MNKKNVIIAFFILPIIINIIFGYFDDNVIYGVTIGILEGIIFSIYAKYAILKK